MFNCFSYATFFIAIDKCTLLLMKRSIRKKRPRQQSH